MKNDFILSILFSSTNQTDTGTDLTMSIPDKLARQLSHVRDIERCFKAIVSFSFRIE